MRKKIIALMLIVITVLSLGVVFAEEKDDRILKNIGEEITRVVTKYMDDEEEEHTHSWSGYKYDSDSHWQECSCGAKQNSGKHNMVLYQGGSDQHYRKCSTCGRTVYGNHDWTAWKSVDENNHQRTCKVCGKVATQAHNTEWKKVDYNEHKKDVCSICKGGPWQENHVITGGAKGVDHKCKKCDATASDYEEWGSQHWFNYPNDGEKCNNPNCTATLKRTDKLDETNISKYPIQDKYEMIGSGHDWEKKASTVTVDFNYPPYMTKEDQAVKEVKYTILTFLHENYAYHDNAYKDYQEDWIEQKPGEDLLELPEEYIQEPISKWGLQAQVFAGIHYTEIVDTVLNGSETHWEANLPSGHGALYQVIVDGRTQTGFDHKEHLYVNGSCSLAGGALGSSAYTEILGYVKVIYRDINAEKIPGAPQDKNYTELAWSYKNSDLYIPVDADHENLDRLGWRYKGYKLLTGLTTTPKASDLKKLEKESHVNVGPLGLNRRQYTVVFVYEPIMLEIKHYVKIGNTGEKILIDTTKNTLEPVEFHNAMNSTADPNHVCTSASCNCKIETDEGREYVTQHNITSLNKFIWPGYILLGWELNTKDGKLLKDGSYNVDVDVDKLTDSSDLSKITTFLDDDPRIEEVQKKVGVSTALNTKESVGHKSDMVIEFEYSTITIKVSHHNMSGDYLKDTNGVNLGPANMILTGVSFYIPSLVTLGTNTWGLTGQTYNAEGYLFKEVKIFNGVKELGTWGPVDSTYFWAFTSSGGAVGPGILNEIQKIGNDITVKFYYESLENEVIVKHQDTNGTTLAPDEHHKMEPEGVDVMPKKELLDNGWNNEHYEDSGERHDPPYESVHVENQPGKRTIIFVYVTTKPTNPPNPVTPPPDGGYTPDPDAKATVLLRSNTRGDNEEYNVETSIPTSEDLYGNIYTNSFILKNEYHLRTMYVPLQIKLVKKYYVTNNTDIIKQMEEGRVGKDIIDEASEETTTITVKVPVQYYSSEGCVLEILNKALMKDDAMQAEGIEGDGKGRATIIANYETIPHFDYTKGGQIVGLSGTPISDVVSGDVTTDDGDICKGQLVSFTYTIPELDHRKPDMAKIEKEYSNAGVILDILANNGAKIRMDRCHVIKEDGGDWIVLSGAELPLARTFTVTELKTMGENGIGCRDLVDPTPWTGPNTLYRNTDMWVQKTSENKTYDTFADIYFKQYQKIGVNDVEAGDPAATATSYIDVPGNKVVVHTPVVDYASLDLTENNKHNQLVNKQENAIVMGETFTIVIPHNGAHKDAPGYGNKAYNWDGALKEDESTFKGHAGQKPSSDSFAMKKQAKFDFGIVYKDTYYRAGTWIDLEASQERFDFMIPTWEDEVWNGKTTKIYTRVIAENAIDDGKVNSSQVNANTDISKYTATQDFVVKIIGKMYDIQIRATDDAGWTNMKNVLTASGFPIGQAGQNSVTGYRYGLKMGAKAYFDLKVDGGTGQTSKTIEAVPKYYYVSKNGGEAQEVDLYYHRIGERFVSLTSNPVTITERMSQNYGVKYFANYNENLGITRRVTGNTVNYTVDNSLGDTSKIILNAVTRIVAYRTSQELTRARWGKDIGNLPTDQDKIISSIGRWYGEVKVPASTVVVTKGTPIADVKAGKGALKNGYLIVAFESLITKAENGDQYLSYAKPDGNTQWQKEAYEDDIALPNGNVAWLPASAKDYAMVIYETDVRINNDYESTGTH